MADVRIKRNKEGEPVAWLVRWRENGKQRYRQFRNEADAEAFRLERGRAAESAKLDEQTRRSFERGELSTSAAAFLELDSGAAMDDRWSVTEYARRMIEADGDLRNGTRHTYLRALRRYFEGTKLGRADVRTVTPQQITDWWAGIGKGRADARRMLSKVLHRAIAVGDRDDDPLRRAPEVKKPRRVREVDFDPLTADQIEDLADAATRATKGFAGRVGEMTRQRDRLLILVMGFAGLRAGEAAGLRMQDLVKTPDGKCQLRIRQQIVRDEPQEPPRVASLKTSAARRTITIACSLWEELKAFAAEFGPAEDGRVFRGPNGEMRDGVLIRNTVKAAARRAGMPGVHPHLLRHSAVSLLIHAGANPRAIQAFVGHTDVSMTLGVYGHLFDQSGTELAEIMEGLREQHRNGRTR